MRTYEQIRSDEVTRRLKYDHEIITELTELNVTLIYALHWVAEAAEYITKEFVKGVDPKKVAEKILSWNQ